MNRLKEDVIIKIFHHLDEESIINFWLSSKNAFNMLCSSRRILRNFNLKINDQNLQQIVNHEIFKIIKFSKITIFAENFTNYKVLKGLIERYKESLEILEIKNLKLKSFSEVQAFFESLSSLNNLKNLKMVNCSVNNLNGDKLGSIKTLEEISFNNCNENIFKIFTNQTAFEKIEACNNDWTWNGFHHDEFNKICKNCKNLNHIVLDGAGTGSYFDFDEFPFKVTTLETTMITFHWYVGIKNPRVNFLESQKGNLKELTIYELPYGFDGGKVLKYIIEEMNLNNFYYGKIPLILNGQKQKVKEFTASEIQITSAYELLRQFECDKFILKLSNTDIASDAIERIIKPTTVILNNLKEFEVIDNSFYRGIFGVFLGLYNNLSNIQKLTLRTQDRNINTFLECLEAMPDLKEIHQQTSTAARAKERKFTKLIIKIRTFKTLRKVGLQNYLKVVTKLKQRHLFHEILMADQNVIVTKTKRVASNNNDYYLLFDNEDFLPVEAVDDDSDLDEEILDDVDSSLHVEIVVKNEEFHIFSRFQGLAGGFRKFYVIPFGYPATKLSDTNIDEINEIFQNMSQVPAQPHIQYWITESGHFVVNLLDDESFAVFRRKLSDVAFQVAGRDIKYPLFILLHEPRVHLSCLVANYIDRDEFLTTVPLDNRINPTRWFYDHSVLNDDGQHEIFFSVDPLSYKKIMDKNHRLLINDVFIPINIIQNIFKEDMDAILLRNNQADDN